VSSEKEGPVSAVLRGVSSHTAEELERAFEDCIGVVSVAYEDGEYLAGGGASYAYLARALKGYADTIGGREQMAIDSFAQALESIPRTLAENAGVDPVNAMIELRKQVSDTPKDAVKGVAINGAIEDMVSRGVLEPSRVVSNAIKSSTEAAISILRIDDVLSMSVSTPAMPGGF
jgi:chaperonin GroEL (HSP60 family)